jgi:hypothetical protein
MRTVNQLGQRRRRHGGREASLRWRVRERAGFVDAKLRGMHDRWRGAVTTLKSILPAYGWP